MQYSSRFYRSSFVAAIVLATAVTSSTCLALTKDRGCGEGYPITSCNAMASSADCAMFYQVDSKDDIVASNNGTGSKQRKITVTGQPCAWKDNACSASNSTCTNTYTSNEFGGGQAIKDAMALFEIYLITSQP